MTEAQSPIHSEDVEPDTERPVIRRIVVGVDGSDSTRAALRHAVAEAERWQAVLAVVSAWEYPWQWSEGFNPNWAEDEAWYAKQAEDQTARMVDEAVGAPWPDWVEVQVRRGPAVAALIEAAADADLLVVGSRGRGGFRGMLLGSVSNGCVHHAPCPVTVVRAR